MSIKAPPRASRSPIILPALLSLVAPSSAGEADRPYDYKAHPVAASDPLAHTTWLGTGPGAAVDGIGGGSTRPFAYKAYVRKPWLNPYERKGHQDVGGAGWTEPWTPDSSEAGAPTADWPARLKLDYGSPVAVAKLALYFPVQGNGDSYLAPTAHAALLEAVEVLRSEDGRQWESAIRIDRLPWTSPQVIEIPRPKPARYYILSVESMAPGNDALRIYEVETYTDPGAAVIAEPVLPPAPEDRAPSLGGPGRGEISCPGGACRFELAGGGLELAIEKPGSSVRI